MTTHPKLPKLAKLWKIGDRVRFAHQKKGEAASTIKFFKATEHGPMVELEELPGEFAAHLFVAAEEGAA